MKAALGIATVLAASWLAADTVATIVSARSIETPSAVVHEPGLAPQAHSQRSLEQLDVIAQRNVFDSRPPLRSSPQPANVCTASFRVISTLPVANAPERSLATVRLPASGPVQIVVIGIGQRIGDAGILVRVDRDAVEVTQPTGRRERCEITPRTQRSTPVRAASAGIRRVSGTRYVLRRSAVDAALARMDTMTSDVRIVPYLEKGQLRGFKLYAIRPHSLVAQLGFHNGDVIRRVNGYELDSADKPLELYSSLKNESAFAVDITRGSQRATLEYEIVP